MESIYIHLEHCYGIPSFNYTFRFDNEREKAHLIYAPNGTMKSSFAHTLHDVCADPPVESRDRYFPERPYCRIIRHDSEDGTDLAKEEILVFESYNSSIKPEKMSLLLANKDLKDSYDRILRELEATMERLLSSLTRISGKKTARELLLKDFGIEETDLYRFLCKLFDEYAAQELADYSGIVYGHLFTADSEKILCKPEVVLRIDEYFKQYVALLTTSSVFTENFSHSSAKATLSALSKEGFFRARHKVILRDTTEGLNEDQFREKIDAEKERIIKKELSEEFDKLDKELGQKSGDIAFRNYLFDHQELIPELHDVAELKKRLRLYYLFINRDLFQEAVLCYRRNEKELTDIISDAKGQELEWHDIVHEFNNRFINMPFILEIRNIEDVVLKQTVPIISFMFKSGADTASVEESELLKRLSEGERKALYLLNVLFEIKVRIKEKRKILVVFDDIADSFDYKNKYAIIEYLIDIIEGGYFLPIILTHNFDFYRTLSERAGIQSSSHFIQVESGRLNLGGRGYTKNVFCNWRESIYKNKRILIAAIPFIRNLVEYKEGQQDDNYIKLTFLLHYKKNGIEEKGIPGTEEITLAYLFELYENIWGLDRSQLSLDLSRYVVDMIFDEAKEIASSFCDPILLELKIIMSIAIRLIAERYMVFRIIARTGNESLIDEIENNQTRTLKKLSQFDIGNSDDFEKMKIIDRVLLMTSENIHINSFMYEPLIDMSLDELINLYNQVTKKLAWDAF